MTLDGSRKDNLTLILFSGTMRSHWCGEWQVMLANITFQQPVLRLRGFYVGIPLDSLEKAVGLHHL